MKKPTAEKKPRARPHTGKRTPVQSAPIAGRVFLERDLPAKGILYGKTHLRRLVDRGDFPAPIRLSPRKPAWLETDLDRWIAERAAASAA